MQSQAADPLTPPLEFVERIRRQLGAEADSFLRALAAPPLGLRANTFRIEPPDLRRIVPFTLVPAGFPPCGFLVPTESRPGRSPYHAAGLYYLQDPGAMAAGALVGAQPGERVLDVAAAPGGKSTQIAAQMNDQGVLVANDPQPERARELAGNLERWGTRSAIVTAEPLERLAAHFGAWFDRVLLDAPCSGEAMFHKSAAACADWSVASVHGCARRQAELLTAAAALVRPGGRLIYSTCTFSPEENEQVVGGFLDRHPGFEIAEVPIVDGAARANPAWAGDAARREELHRAIRFWPHRFPGAGHFVAALVRREGNAGAEPRTHRAHAPGEALRAWAEFQRSALRADVTRSAAFDLRGDLLSVIPASAPDLTGLRLLRTGLPLGTVRKGRLDPAHALAMALRPDEVQAELRLPADSPEVFAYLRGETLSAPGPAGWVLVTVQGFPLGWGKRVGATVKNHYPKGLRRHGRRPS